MIFVNLELGRHIQHIRCDPNLAMKDDLNTHSFKFEASSSSIWCQFVFMTKKQYGFFQDKGRELPLLEIHIFIKVYKKLFHYMQRIIYGKFFKSSNLIMLKFSILICLFIFFITTMLSLVRCAGSEKCT